MNQILSTSNERFKQFSRLATQAKARRKEKLTVLHGVHLAKAYFELGLVPKQVIYCDGAENDSEVADILSQATNAGVDATCFVASAQRAISGVDNGVGLALVIDIPAEEASEPISKSALLLDTVQDPSNVGALVRTAVAAGVESIYLSSGCASAWSPRSLRAGMGGQFAASIFENCNLDEVIDESRLPVLATSLEAEQTIYDVDLSQLVAWLFGNEGSGVSPQLLAKTQQVTIPQSDKVESLNVAASVAVCLFEQNRQVIKTL